MINCTFVQYICLLNACVIAYGHHIHVVLNITRCYSFVLNLNILLFYCLGIQEAAIGAERLAAG